MLAAQSSLPPPFPRTNATKLLETEQDRRLGHRLAQGAADGHASPRLHDQVGTVLRSRRATHHACRTARQAVGDDRGRQPVDDPKKGPRTSRKAPTDPPLRAVFIELKKEGPSGLPEVSRDLPSAFPARAPSSCSTTSRRQSGITRGNQGTPRFTYRAAARHRGRVSRRRNRDVHPTERRAGDARGVTGPDALSRARLGRNRRRRRRSARAIVFELK